MHLNILPSFKHHVTLLLRHHTFPTFIFCVYFYLEPAPKLVPRPVPSPPVAGLLPNKLPPAVLAPKPEMQQKENSNLSTNPVNTESFHLFMSSVVSIPNVDVLVPAPKVSAGLLPNSPVPVPNDGALVVVVPNPAVLFPNKFCNNSTCTDCYKMTPIQPVTTTTNLCDTSSPWDQRTKNNII